MHSDQHFLRKKAVLPLANQVGNGYMHIPVASAFDAVLTPTAKHLTPFHGVEFNLLRSIQRILSSLIKLSAKPSYVPPCNSPQI